MIEAALLKNIFFMLAITLSVLFISVYFLKHIKKLTPHYMSNIEILGMTNLWNKNKVVLLKAYGIELLIGVSDSNVQTLYVFNKPLEINKEASKVSAIREVTL